MKLPMAFTICTFGVKPPRHVGGRKEVLGDEKTDREGGGEPWKCSVRGCKNGLRGC
jgi:hypothetical protein